MSSVVSTILYSEKPWANGLVKRRYYVVLSDEQAVESTHVIGPFKVTPDTDVGAAKAQAFLAYLKKAEASQYVAQVEGGVNPFLSSSKWNTRAELLYAVLAKALTSSADSEIVLKGLPFIAKVTDAELIALFSKDQAWVDSVRAQATALLSGKAVLDAYEPVGI